MMAETASTLDVGASLGIMCGFGGLVYLMTPKLRTTLTVAAISGFLIYAVASKDLIGIDHAFAIGVGLYVTRKYFGYQPSQKVFDTIERKYFERRKEVEIEEPQHAEKRAS